MTTPRIVLANFGSFGDLHPYLGIARELQRRGHHPVIATVPHYREKIEAAGFEFHPVRFAELIEKPDAALMEKILHPLTGAEFIIRDLVMPLLRTAYDDSLLALDGASLLISHPLTFAARLAAEARGLPWISTQLAPFGMLSRYDPPVLPPTPVFSRLRGAGPAFWGPLIALGKFGARRWTATYTQLRVEIGLPPARDPMFEGGASALGTLALFSPLLGSPQRDWPAHTLQTGFVFYDGEERSLPPELEAFLQAGEPPIVFTLGTAAVHNAGKFYQQSASAAQMLGRRAVLLIGDAENRPASLPDGVIAVNYAPFSQLLPRAAAVVHQGGVGTTAQAMRSGKPMLVMPYGVDQPDNAERVRRLGIARVVSRKAYSADRAAREMEALFRDRTYRERAHAIGQQVREEAGAIVACDAIERILSGSAPLR
ncbi:MAG: glycosyltransferase [Janthinobacterium lividum]